MKFKSLIFVFFVLFAIELHCENKFIAFPKAYSVKEFNYNYGLEVSRLPMSIGEDVFQQLPLVSFDCRYGLIYNFSASAKLRSIYVTNSLALGLQWSYDKDKFAFALGNSFELWYGYSNLSNMDASARGLIFIPSLALGYDFDNIFVSSKFEASLMTTLSRAVGSSEIELSKNQFVGVKGSLIIEQAIYNETFLLLGFKLNYSRYYYPSWLAFNSTRYWLIIPEFQIGIKL